MKKKRKSNEETCFDLVCRFFLAVERQGPGSDDTTLRALQSMDCLSDEPYIADLGCGTGVQSMLLAQHTRAKIIGVDMLAPFVERYNYNAERLNLAGRVKGVVGDMAQPPVDPNSLDVIWSEGSVYNVGFERALASWRRYLKDGGYVAVSDCVWYSDDRDSKIEDFWSRLYPDMQTVKTRVGQLFLAGYEPLEAVVLPDYCWTENYFKPLNAVGRRLVESHPGDKDIADFAAQLQLEEDMYSRYADDYCYVIFVARKMSVQERDRIGRQS